jgi:hypothetical protein
MTITPPPATQVQHEKIEAVLTAHGVKSLNQESVGPMRSKEQIDAIIADVKAIPKE